MFKKLEINVPIELVQFAHAHKMHKALGVYLLMNASCNGHMILTDDLKNAFMGILKIKDIRSFSKYLNKLQNENWIGFDPVNEVYYIRGSGSLRKRYCFYNSGAVVFNVNRDAQQITDFIHGAIISHDVRRRDIARKGKIKKLTGSSAFIKESAIQELAAKKLISAYTGLSLSVISKLLDVSQSYAGRIKMKIWGLGYITVKDRYNIITTTDQPDYSIIKYLPNNRRYSVKKKVKKKKVIYEFRERGYDEIHTNMEFRKQKSIVRRIWNLEIGGGQGVEIQSP